MKVLKCLLIAAALTTSSTALAQSTTTPDFDGDCVFDADCPDGYSCDVFERGSCPTCLDGEDCPPCLPPEEIGYCSPPPPAQCASDSDCAADDVCVTYGYETCSGGGSVTPGCDPDDGDCSSTPPPEPSEPSECTSVSESYCVPSYVAPCNADADCGDGFNCKDIQLCSCSSGDPVDSDTGSGEDSPGDVRPPDECECSDTGEKYCELIEVECATDSECDGDLNCEDFGPPPSVRVPCPEDGPCDTTPIEPEPESIQRCAPEGYAGWANSGAGGTDRIASATGQEHVSAEERISWGNDSGTKSSDDGCSTTNSNPTGLLPLFLVGLVGLIRRRRV